MAKYDYSAKEVYMGIDVHKKTYCCVSICDGNIVKRDAMQASPAGLLKYIQNTFTGAKLHTAYEAGFSGFHLHRFLLENSIDNIVVHPGSIEVASRDRVKTDKRDAKKIAEQLAVNRLRGIFVPSIKQEANRSITRLRKNIWKLRTQVGAQLKSLLFTLDLIACEDDTLVNTLPYHRQPCCLRRKTRNRISFPDIKSISVNLATESLVQI